MEGKMNKKFTLLGRKAKIKKLMATIALASVISSITVTGFGEAAFAATAPPATWQEHWFEHNQNLKLAYYNDDIAVYLDDDINKSNVTWVNSYMTDVWKYVKKTYGQMGGDGRLYIILHNKYGGGH